MGDKFEQLRLTTALAHLIPGAELLLRSQDDVDYRVKSPKCRVYFM